MAMESRPDAMTELRILMLEDSPTDAELMEREVRKAGIPVHAKRVETQEEFVAALDTFRPDVVLSDYKLPNFDGLSALKLVRRDHPEIPVIIVTGALPDTDAVELLNSGARDYVLKDRLARLAPAIQHVLSAEKGIRARKAAEHALHESYFQVQRARDEWNAAFDAMRDLVFFHDHDWRITRCNRAYAIRAGLPFEEIIGRYYWEVFPKGSGPLASCAAEIEETAERKEQEIRLPSGETFVSRSFSARNAEGQYLFSVHVMEDFSERKRTEELIRKNSQLLETVFSSIHVMVAYLDRDFNFIKVNKAYAAADQRTPEFFPGKNHFELYPSDEHQAIFRKVVESGEPAIYYAQPFTYTGRPERGVGYRDWRLEPIKGLSGRVEGLLFSVLDVTEQTLAVRKIEAASKYARSLIEASLDPLVTISAEGKITDVNEATEKATGRSRAELIGTDFSDYFTEPDKARTGYRQAFAVGFVTDYPLAIRHRDGRIMDVLYHATVYRDDAGQVMGVFAAARDVTERKLAEDKLRQSEASLAEAQQLAHIGNWSWEFASNTVIRSPEYCRIYNFDPAQQALTYEEQLKVYTAESQARLDAAVKRAMEHGEPYALELELAKPDMAGKWIYARAEAKRDAQGKITGLYGTSQDITERKKNERALQQLNRALKALSAGNHSLVHSQSELELMQGMCSAITDGNNYPLAWVGTALQDENKSIKPVAVAGAGQRYVDELRLTWADVPQGRGPTGTAVRIGQTQICQDFGDDPRMEPWREAAAKYGLASSIALPLREGETVTGVLTLYAAEPGAFDPQEVALLEEMAGDLNFGLAALRTRTERDRALTERRAYADQLRASLEDALQAISATVEMRDPYTAGHQRRVADMAAAIAREMNLPEEQIRGIHLAGIVHDLGKIHVPAEILSKPVQLTEIEFSLIKIHPQAGHDILKGIAFPWPIAQAVLQHHERADGSGYPQGLTGDSILLDARILAVADVVEAMASHRPYRPGLGLDAALSEIRDKRGTQYDASVVDACLNLFANRGYELPA